MELNIGCGMDTRGDVSVDIVTTSEVDVLGSAICLPFAKESFDTVLMNQVIEHIPPEDLPDLFDELYRVLEPGGVVKLWIPHAATRLYDQDPTHVSRWTYGTIDYFTDGSFSWYFDDRKFEFELCEREINVWSHHEVRLSGLRSQLLQLLNRFFSREDSLLYWPTVAGSLHIEIRKV